MKLKLIYTSPEVETLEVRFDENLMASGDRNFSNSGTEDLDEVSDADGFGQSIWN